METLLVSEVLEKFREEFQGDAEAYMVLESIIRDCIRAHINDAKFVSLIKGAIVHGGVVQLGRILAKYGCFTAVVPADKLDSFLRRVLE